MNKIKGIFVLFLLKILSKLLLRYTKRIVQTLKELKNTLTLIVFCKVPFEKKDDTPLVGHVDQAYSVVTAILNERYPEDMDKETFEIKRLLVLEEKDVQYLIFEYDAIKCYYEIISNAIKTEGIREAIKIFSKKRKENSIKYLQDSELKKIKKEVTVIKKEWLKFFKAIKNEQFLADKCSIFNLKIISKSDLSYFGSFILFLFSVTGYFYNKIFFAYFGINAQHFLTASDYLHASFDSLIQIFISSFIGICFLFAGFNSEINRQLEEYHFEVKCKKDTIMIPMIIILSTITLVYQAFIGDDIWGLPMYSLLLFLSVEFVFRLRVFEIFGDKSFLVRCLAISFVIFSLQFYNKLNNEIKEVYINSNTQKYDIVLTQKYKKFENHKLIKSTEKYIFMWSKERQQIIIIPQGALLNIKPLQPK